MFLTYYAVCIACLCFSMVLDDYQSKKYMKGKKVRVIYIIAAIIFYIKTLIFFILSFNEVVKITLEWQLLN